MKWHSIYILQEPIMPAVVKLAALRDLVESKTLRAAAIVGQKGGWGVELRYGQAVRQLAGKSGSPKVFTRIDTAARQLLKLGIASFEVHAADYEAAALRPRRPDRAAALKAGHAYTAWLKEQVRHTRARIVRGEAKLYIEVEAVARLKEKRAQIQARAVKTGA
jgi:hypothetical protein